MNTKHIFEGVIAPSEAKRRIAHMSDDQKKMLSALGISVETITHAAFIRDSAKLHASHIKK